MIDSERFFTLCDTDEKRLRVTDSISFCIRFQVNSVFTKLMDRVRMNRFIFSTICLTADGWLCISFTNAAMIFDYGWAYTLLMMKTTRAAINLFSLSLVICVRRALCIVHALHTYYTTVCSHREEFFFSFFVFWIRLRVHHNANSYSYAFIHHSLTEVIDDRANLCRSIFCTVFTVIHTGYAVFMLLLL